MNKCILANYYELYELCLLFCFKFQGVINDGSARTAEGYELSFGVNHLGHFLLTNLLLAKLQSSSPSRIINVSSDAYQLGRLDFDEKLNSNIGRVKSYARSKLANLLFTHELAKTMEGKGVSTFALHPGMVIRFSYLNKSICLKFSYY